VCGWLHNGYYIIALNRYIYDEDSEESTVYDNFSKWESLEVYEDAFYLKVIDAELIEDEYKIMVDIEGKHIL